MNDLALNAYHPKRGTARSFWDAVGIPSRGVKLHEALHHGMPYAVFKRLAQVTGMEQKELVVYTKLSTASLARRAKSGHFTPEESDRLYRFADVFNAATELFDGDIIRGRRWLSTPAPGLGGRRPIEMLGTTAEHQSVLDLIGRLEHGVVV